MLGPSVVVGATPFALGVSICAVRKPEARVTSYMALVISAVVFLALVAVLAMMWWG